MDLPRANPSQVAAIICWSFCIVRTGGVYIIADISKAGMAILGVSQVRDLLQDISFSVADGTNPSYQRYGRKGKLRIH